MVREMGRRVGGVRVEGRGGFGGVWGGGVEKVGEGGGGRLGLRDW